MKTMKFICETYAKFVRKQSKKKSNMTGTNHRQQLNYGIRTLDRSITNLAVLNMLISTPLILDSIVTKSAQTIKIRWIGLYS